MAKLCLNYRGLLRFDQITGGAGEHSDPARSGNLICKIVRAPANHSDFTGELSQTLREELKQIFIVLNRDESTGCSVLLPAAVVRHAEAVCGKEGGSQCILREP